MIYSIYNKQSLKIAADLINNGEIIVYPTDTIYGFGVDATNDIAVNKLNNLKKRKQAYSIIVNSIDMLKKYAQVDYEVKDQLSKYLPGPYTLIFKKNKSNLANLTTSNLKTVGIRIPKHFFPCKLVEVINKPIVTTSINFHTMPPLTDIHNIKKVFNNINIFKDMETSEGLRSSTIIDFTTKEFKVLRK